MKIFQSTSSRKTEQLGARYGRHIHALATKRRRAIGVFLYGELGSGKTTFVRGFVRALGVRRSVQSPTFILERQYETTKKYLSRIYHFDLYRLGSVSAGMLRQIRERFLQERSIVLIEWPEKIPVSLRRGALRVYLYHGKKSTMRKIKIISPLK